MPIGFVVAATIMALPLSQDVVGWQALAIGVLLAGLPLLDTSLVILSRRRAGVSLLPAGRDHLTHRLRSRLPSARAVALALGAVQAALCAVALWLSQHGESSTTVAWALLLFAGAAAVTIMETQAWAPVRVTPDDAPATDEDHASATAGRQEAPDPERGDRSSLLRTYPLEVALVLVVAAACGLSPLLYGFYDLSTWGPIALGLLAVLLGLVIAGRPSPGRPR